MSNYLNTPNNNIPFYFEKHYQSNDIEKNIQENFLVYDGNIDNTYWRRGPYWSHSPYWRRRWVPRRWW